MLALAWQIFVLVPFSVYLLGVLVRLLVFFHEKSEWPLWTFYAVFLPILLVLENVLGLRDMLILNVKQIMWFLLNPYDFSQYSPILSQGDLSYNQEVICKTAWRYQPLRGLDFLWLFFYGPDGFKWIVPTPDSIPESGFAVVDMPPDWAIGYCAWFPTDAWAKVLIWLFVIVPITVFTWYVYEPASIRRRREMYWNKLVKSSSVAAKEELDAQAVRGHARDTREHIGSVVEGIVEDDDEEEQDPLTDPAVQV